MMKFSRHILVLTALSALALMASSCHHHGSDEDSAGTLSGSLVFSIPDYVNPGQVYELVPRGITRDDGGSFGFYWTASPYITARDTTRYENDPASVKGEWTLEIPDELETLTVSCTAYADGFYSSTKTKSVMIVKPGESLTGLNLPETVFTDVRDGLEYAYTGVGSLDWMAENLRWQGAGVPFDDCKAMQDIFGSFYTWTEAVSACPEGWRLPSEEDWADLAAAFSVSADGTLSFPKLAGSLMADAYFNGVKYWEYWPAVKITNESGFSAYPSGYAVSSSSGNTWEGSGNYAAYWTASEDAEGLQAIYRYIYVSQPDVFAGYGDKDSFRLPVRCVRGSEAVLK